MGLSSCLLDWRTSRHWGNTQSSHQVLTASSLTLSSGTSKRMGWLRPRHRLVTSSCPVGWLNRPRPLFIFLVGSLPSFWFVLLRLASSGSSFEWMIGPGNLQKLVMLLLSGAIDMLIVCWDLSLPRVQNFPPTDPRPNLLSTRSSQISVLYVSMKMCWRIFSFLMNICTYKHTFY